MLGMHAQRDPNAVLGRLQVLVGRWRLEALLGDGTTWETDFDVTYRRAR